MDNEKVYQMPFAKVYPLLLNKAIRKGRTQAEVDEVISWLTGYKSAQLQEFMKESLTYGDFLLMPLVSIQIVLKSKVLYVE